jgi:putative effector of murein hydrolase
MITLGLLTHTHRDLLRLQWRALALATIVGAPVGLLATAGLGALLGLSATEITSTLPATTTTGLALTMADVLPDSRCVGSTFADRANCFSTALPLHRSVDRMTAL